MWFLLHLVLVAATCHDYRARFSISKVIDGDTVSFDVSSFMPAPLNTSLSLRVRGVDCPESGSRAKCPREATLASEATAFTKSMLDRYQVADTGIRICAWDKYGGRVLGDLIFWDDEQSTTTLSTSLISAGHAVEYSGRGVRQDWCLGTCSLDDALDG